MCGAPGIEVPILQGPLGGPWQQGIRLAAAVSDAGASGSVPTTLRTPTQVRDDVRRLRDLTETSPRPPSSSAELVRRLITEAEARPRALADLTLTSAEKSRDAA